jgi:type VI secretion system secreted protein Hcp
MTLQVSGGLVIQNLIPVLAWSEGISTSCTTSNACPVPNQQDISLTMYQSTDFILLRKALLLRTPINIEVVNTFTNGDVSKIFLEEAYVSSISDGGSGGEDKLTMNVTISAAKWAHYFDPIGLPIAVHYGWNFVSNSMYSHY